MAVQKIYAICKGSTPNRSHLFVSSDDGLSWNNDNDFLDNNIQWPEDYRVRPDNQNFLIYGTYYNNMDGNALGIVYSSDGGSTYDVCGGNWSGFLFPGDPDAHFNWIHIVPTDPSIVFAITVSGIDKYDCKLFKSTDGGVSFNYLYDTGTLFGEKVDWASVYSPDGVNIAITLRSETYISYDGGVNWTQPKSPSPYYKVVCTSSDFSSIYVSDVYNVYKLNGSFFNSVYTYPGGSIDIRTVTLESVGDDSYQTQDSKYLLRTINGFASVTQGTNLLQETYLRPSYYNYSTGYSIDVIEGVKYPYRVFKTTDAGATRLPLAVTVDSATGAYWTPSYVRVAREGIVTCGCPEGTVYNEETGLCETTTNVCLEGSTWNPVTQQCEIQTDPCLLDLTIVIDQSSSINASEQASLKSFLYNLIDDIEDSGGANRITSDNVRIGLVTFGNTGTNLLSLAGGTGAWTSLPAGGTIKSAISGLPATPAGATATFDGLRSGYLNLTGANSRNGVANKRILFITDGWPNWTSGVSYNGINPGTGVADGSCPITPISANDPLRCADSTWTANKRQNYYAAMQLAEDIKNGSGPDMIDPAAITLVVVGAQQERTQTIGAFVGGLNVTVTDSNIFPNIPFPGGSTVSLTNTTYFSVCQWDLATSGNPSANSNTNTYCKYWDAWYPEDGTGGYYFPSDNLSGDPDYFDTTFNNLSNILISIKTSLICSEPAPQTDCIEPCVFNDQTGDCVCSSDTFNPCCYDLLDCKTGLPIYTVNTYSLGYDPLAPYIGQVITIEGTQECLFLQVTTNCTNTTPFPLDSALAIVGFGTDCVACQNKVDPELYYKLTRCDNEDIFIYTKLNFAFYLDKVVNLTEYPDLCWTVSTVQYVIGPFVNVNVSKYHSDCLCCLNYQCI